MSKARIIHELHDDLGVTISEAKKAYDIAVEYIRLRSAIGDHPEDYKPSEYVLVKASSQKELYQEKLKEIADALSEKFAYLNTCLNERDIILGYLGVERPSKIHCNTDCTNSECKSNYRYNKLLSEESKWHDCDMQKDDVIYRQQAIDAIRASASKYTGFMEMELYTDDNAVEAIEGLPPAQPDWIPCSEKLPEEIGTYLVTLDYKEHGKGVTTFWYHGKQIGWDLRVADVVVAWMPLPEPWKG